MSPFVKNSNGRSINYNLCSTNNHLGDDLATGHYTAFIKASNLSFFCFNDSSVAQVSTDDVLQSKAPYIVFYEMEPSSWSAQQSGLFSLYFIQGIC